MTVACVLYESREAARLAGDGTVPVGAMWFDPELAERRVAWLSTRYWSENAHRPPLRVMLPDRSEFLVDGVASGGADGDSGWQVTGEPPRITVHPSIDVGYIHPEKGRISTWHGWLQDGVLAP